jgi:hypothetical protein
MLSRVPGPGFEPGLPEGKGILRPNPCVDAPTGYAIVSLVRLPFSPTESRVVYGIQSPRVLPHIRKGAP